MPGPLNRGARLYPEFAIDTLMNSKAAHRPRVCLTQDDYEGLHALYPTCNERVNDAPSCNESLEYSGMFRLMVSVMIPFACAVGMLLMTQTLAKYIQRIKMQRLERQVHRQNVEQFAMRASLHEANEALQKAETALARMSRVSSRATDIFAGPARLTGRVTDRLSGLRSTGRLSGLHKGRLTRRLSGLYGRLTGRLSGLHQDGKTASSNTEGTSDAARSKPHHIQPRTGIRRRQDSNEEAPGDRISKPPRVRTRPGIGKRQGRDEDASPSPPHTGSGDEVGDKVGDQLESKVSTHEVRRSSLRQATPHQNDPIKKGRATFADDVDDTNAGDGAIGSARRSDHEKLRTPHQTSLLPTTTTNSCRQAERKSLPASIARRSGSTRHATRKTWNASRKIDSLVTV